MRFLSVATFAWPDHYGGAERVIGEVTRGLVQRGHEVTLLTSRGAGQLAREIRDGVQVRRYDVDRGSPVRFYRSVFAGVRGALRHGDLPPHDVLHLHQMLSGVAAVAPGLGRHGAEPRGAVIGSFYAPYNEEYLARFRDGHAAGGVPWSARAVSAVLRHGDRALLRASREIVVLSRFSLGQVTELLPAAAAHTTVAAPGVDLARFTPARDLAAKRAAAATFGLPSDGTPLLLSVRRLVPRMGLPDLIDAAALLSARGMRCHVVLGGSGEQRDALVKRAAAAGLAGRCTFLGSVDDALLPDLYRAASVFVLPTRGLEGFGMSTAEALASGLPVVATHVGATAELLAGVAGSVLVPPADPEALAGALMPLLTDASACANAGRAARAHAEARLTWDVHLAAVEQAGRARVGLDASDAVKIVALTRTSARGPSSRYRIEQYRAALAAEGLHVETAPLFGDRWFSLLEWRNAPLRALGKACYSAARLPVRVAQAMAADAGNADLVHIEQQLFPYLPWVLESLLWPRRKPVVLEFDDAIFLTFAHRRKLERACARADLVIVGNRFLAEFATPHARRVTVIPTTVDVARYRHAPRAPDGVLRVGWIGLRYNFPYLHQLVGPLARLAADGFAVELRVISSAAPDLGPRAATFPVVHRPWSEAGEAAEIAACDVGIMPLPDNDWARGKCGLKLLQFMAAGLPVVASPVGFNRELIKDGMNGLLAADEAGWESALRRLRGDPALASRLGAAGHRTVEEQYSLPIGTRHVSDSYRQLLARARQP